MSEVEIRHLRYFLAVAETENFTRAAERLNISQPSVSQQITQLEQTLRTSLFRRVGKRVFLTEAGTAFARAPKSYCANSTTRATRLPTSPGSWAAG